MTNNGWIYEPVTIEMLRPGVPFYRANPLEHQHKTLPDYNTNLTDDPQTVVWVVYPSWQKNPFIKKEYFAKLPGNQAAGLVNMMNSDGSLTVRNEE